MIVRLNTALRNVILDCMFNTGSAIAFFDSGTVEFRTGAQPASADNAATGTVVSTVALPADAMAAAAGGSISKNATAWEDTSADNAGTIGYARFKSSGGTYVMDIDVTVTGGGGGITVDNPALLAGQDFQVSSFTLTMPASS